MTVCTCIRDPRDVRRVAVQDPDCPRRVTIGT